MPRTPVIAEALKLRLPTVAGVLAEVRSLADSAFAAHELIAEGEGRWLCRTPGSACNWFRLIVAPQTVIVFGDVGEGVITIAARDPLPWLRARAHAGAFDAEYVISKINGASKIFYPGTAVAAVEDLLRDADEAFARRMRDLVSDIDELDDERAWWNAWQAFDLESEDLCTAYGPSQWSMWTAECIRWFSRALVAREAATAIDLTDHITEEIVS